MLGLYSRYMRLNRSLSKLSPAASSPRVAPVTGSTSSIAEAAAAAAPRGSLADSPVTRAARRQAASSAVSYSPPRLSARVHLIHVLLLRDRVASTAAAACSAHGMKRGRHLGGGEGREWRNAFSRAPCTASSDSFTVDASYHVSIQAMTPAIVERVPGGQLCRAASLPRAQSLGDVGAQFRKRAPSHTSDGLPSAKQNSTRSACRQRAASATGGRTPARDHLRLRADVSVKSAGSSRHTQHNQES